MLRILIGISVLSLLVLTYLASPVMAWVVLGAMFTRVFVTRSRRAVDGGPELRRAIRAIGK